MPLPSFRTTRLLLRPFTDTDLENVFKGLSHPDVIKHYGVRFDSIGATQVQMAWFAAIERGGTGIWRAICSPDDTTFLGAIGLNNIVHEHRKGEIGFWLLPEHWGKGIISEALPVILAHGFGSMGLHRITAEVETDNHASGRVLERCGFIREGTLRDCEIKDGRFISLDVYAQLT